MRLASARSSDAIWLAYSRSASSFRANADGVRRQTSPTHRRSYGTPMAASAAAHRLVLGHFLCPVASREGHRRWRAGGRRTRRPRSPASAGPAPRCGPSRDRGGARPRLPTRRGAWRWEPSAAGASTDERGESAVRTARTTGASGWSHRLYWASRNSRFTGSRPASARAARSSATRSLTAWRGSRRPVSSSHQPAAAPGGGFPATTLPTRAHRRGRRARASTRGRHRRGEATGSRVDG